MADGLDKRADRDLMGIEVLCFVVLYFVIKGSHFWRWISPSYFVCQLERGFGILVITYSSYKHRWTNTVIKEKIKN